MRRFRLRSFFLFGFALGILFALVLIGTPNAGFPTESQHYSSLIDSFSRWLRHKGLKLSFRSSSDSVSARQYMYDHLHISCVVLSSDRRQARAVVGTWGRHCNSLDFVADYEDNHVPVSIKIPLQDKRLLCRTLHRIAVRRLSDEKKRWLFITDDKTFAVIENLRAIIAPLNSSHVHYLGHAIKKSLRGSPLIVNVLNGGIVLSEGALIELLFAFEPDCKNREEISFEDTIALLFKDIPRQDFRDDLGRGVFLPRSLEKLLVKGSLSPYDRFIEQSVYSYSIGSTCCSDHAVAVHSVDPFDMHFFEYLVNGINIGKPFKQSPPLRSNIVPPVHLEGDVSFLPEKPTEL